MVPPNPSSCGPFHHPYCDLSIRPSRQEHLHTLSSIHPRCWPTFLSWRVICSSNSKVGGFNIHSFTEIIYLKPSAKSILKSTRPLVLNRHVRHVHQTLLERMIGISRLTLIVWHRALRSALFYEGRGSTRKEVKHFSYLYLASSCTRRLWQYSNIFSLKGSVY
jgi:hypothetical protein